ncbi:MAG: hypothetical protein AB1717_05785 [Pseudomonadota bacterium]
MSEPNAHISHDSDPLMDATFNEPSMQERVELITHLLRHSDRLFTIMSDNAVLLSGFSHELTRHDTLGLHYAEVYPTAGMDAEDIVMQLARAWNVDVDFGETAMNALFHRLPLAFSEPSRAVAIVHSASNLPPMILDGLIGFMQRLDQVMNGRVRLVLTGSSLLTQRLAPMQTLSGAGQVYALHLQSLGEETSHDTGAEQGFVTPATTPPLVEDGKPVSRPLAQDSDTGVRGLILGGLGISLILAVIVALVMRPDAPKAPKETTVSIPLTPPAATEPAPTPSAPEAQAPLPATENAPAPTVTAAPAPVEAVAPAPAPLPAPPPEVKAIPAPSATPTAAPAASPTQPSVYAATPIIASTPSSSPSPAPAASKPVSDAKAQSKPEKPAHQAEDKSLARTASQHFAKENAQLYVLQIITLGSAKATSQFAKAHGLENCQTFRQQREGKDLFSLTCGLYPNREAALEAQKALPSSALGAKPYPRQVADIRKVMLP